MGWSTGNRADEIIPGIWLGDLVAAHDYDFIKKNNITVIINCTKEHLFSEKVQKSIHGIGLVRIPVRDSRLEKDIIMMEKHLPNVVRLMLCARFRQNRNILVHCYAGKQRSAIVVAAFLKVYRTEHNGNGVHCEKTEELAKIIAFIRARRPKAFGYGWYVNFHKSFLRCNFNDIKTF
jgi:protein-tyrosine phosphatase